MWSLDLLETTAKFASKSHLFISKIRGKATVEDKCSSTDCLEKKK